MSEFIIIVESNADFETATSIAKRVICEQIDWLQDFFSATVQWSGLEPGTAFSCWQDWKRIRENAIKTGISLPRFLGRKQGLKADGAAARKVLQLINQLKRKRDISAVIFIRDLDHQPERRIALEQARNEFENKSSEPAIVVGTANSKREAWVLNGFIAQNGEIAVLAQLTTQLKFDPTVEAHRLRATTRAEPGRMRNVKVVLEELCKPSDDDGREIACWQDTPLDLLRERGTETGLTAYITEIEERLVPLLQ